MLLKYIGRCQPGEDGPKYGHIYHVIGIHKFDYISEYEKASQEYAMTCYIDGNKQSVFYFKSLEEMCKFWEAPLSTSENKSITIHSKLVRDGIPEKIVKNGDFPKYIHINSKYITLDMLTQKLREEVEEYATSNSLEELADIMEVITGILHHKNISIDTLEKIRRDKYHKLGGFENGTYLQLTVSNSNDEEGDK